MFDFEFIVKKIKKVTVQNDFNTIEKYFWYIFVYISWILSDSLKSIKKFKISGNFFLVVEIQKLKKKILQSVLKSPVKYYSPSVWPHYQNFKF